MKRSIKLANGWIAGNIRKNSSDIIELENKDIFWNIGKQLLRGDEKKITLITEDYIPKDRRRFLKMFVDKVCEAVFEASSLNDIKVLFMLIKKMNYENGEILVPNIQISEELKMDKALVSRALKNLVKNNIILIKDGTEKRRVKTYLLNEEYFKYGR